MTVIVETGAGVRLANSYVTSAFVTSYLTNRNDETDWVAAGALVQDAAVIAATDYIEKRFGRQFLGSSEFSFESVQAVATVSFAGLPIAAETLTLGDQVYTFVAALSSPAVLNEVLVGVDATASASNLFDAISANATNEGTTFATGTSPNRHASVEINTTVLTQLDLTALADGEGGNETALAETLTNATIVAFAGGLDGGSQPLSFPRVGLFDSSGRNVLGIPRKLREAVAEYADRARSAALDPDPEVDATGAQIQSKREKVGPIEEETEYVPGTHLVVVTKPYPAADRLLREYVAPAGAVR